MSEPKRRISAIMHERFADKLIELAQLMHQTPNQIVNRLVEESIEQILKKTAPAEPLSTITLARLMMRKNLSYGDRLVQDILAGLIEDWAKYQEEWRAFMLDEANSVDGPLTPEIVEKLKKRADRRTKDLFAAKRATKKAFETKPPR